MHGERRRTVTSHPTPQRTAHVDTIVVHQPPWPLSGIARAEATTEEAIVQSGDSALVCRSSTMVTRRQWTTTECADLSRAWISCVDYLSKKPAEARKAKSVAKFSLVLQEKFKKRWTVPEAENKYAMRTAKLCKRKWDEIAEDICSFQKTVEEIQSTDPSSMTHYQLMSKAVAHHLGIKHKKYYHWDGMVPSRWRHYIAYCELAEHVNALLVPAYHRSVRGSHTRAIELAVQHFPDRPIRCLDDEQSDEVQSNPVAPTPPDGHFITTDRANEESTSQPLTDCKSLECEVNINEISNDGQPVQEGEINVFSVFVPSWCDGSDDSVHTGSIKPKDSISCSLD